MMRAMLKSKVSYATVTQAELYYKGSITIDEEIMLAADLKEHERVEVLNVNNGARLQTYVIKGKPGTGVICLNGPAARSGYKGDKIIVVSYGWLNDEQAKDFKTKFVELGDKNEITNTYMA